MNKNGLVAGHGNQDGSFSISTGPNKVNWVHYDACNYNQNSPCIIDDDKNELLCFAGLPFFSGFKREEEKSETELTTCSNLNGDTANKSGVIVSMTNGTFVSRINTYTDVSQSFLSRDAVVLLQGTKLMGLVRSGVGF